MARDASYQPGVYREHGGNVLVVSTTDGQLNVETGGKIDVKSGATLEIDSGATFTNAATLTNSGTLANTGAIANTGTITNSSDGQLRETVTAKSTAQTLDNYGVSLIGSTASGALAYKLNKPSAAGQHKYITIRKSTAGGLTIVSATATAQLCKFNYTLSKITVKTANQGLSLHLLGATSTTWSIVGFSTAAGTYTCT